ncbi:uncharacterized protein LOC122073413 [Macadamia integrifolia]|uniref:uncharacterized protein LOC122073413 n=1 Tax=Macadamia integrifolia TaxID=60698 RepID=UPI001C500FB1|nr:uncharacterized protein LOC122073413 [Macadamia integrifolia]
MDRSLFPLLIDWLYLINVLLQIPFGNIWHIPTTPKVQFFLWKFLHGRLPIPDLLNKWGFNLPSVCLRCLHPAVDVNQIFRDCVLASQIWLTTGLQSLTQFEDFQEAPTLVRMSHDFAIDFISASPSAYSQQQIFHVSWAHPLVGFVKFNVNGASLGNPGLSGIGGILGTLISGLRVTI